MRENMKVHLFSSACVCVCVCVLCMYVTVYEKGRKHKSS